MDAHNDQHETLPRPLAVVVAMLVAGVVISIWVGAARRGLEYDEVWTLQEYAHAPSVMRVFSDTTPNNHPLNSLLIRWVTSVLGTSEWVVRLPALIAGTCLLVGMPFVVRRMTRRWAVALLATVWVAGNAPFVHYAQTARGYSLQTLLIFAYTIFVLIASSSREQEGRYLTLAAGSGIAAMFALPNAVLFLPPVAVVDIVARAIRWRKRLTPTRERFLVREWRACVTYTALATVCAAWVVHGSVGYVDSQTKLGTHISSFSEWLHFCADMIGQLGLWPMVVLAVAGLCLSVTNRVLWTLDVATLWVFLAAWLLRGWPARAYVPLVPLVCVAAALGLCDVLARIDGKLQRGVTVAAAVLPMILLPSARRRWTPPDWKHLYAVVREAAGTNACIAYPALDGYVLAHYYAPHILVESFHHLPSTGASTLALTEAEGRMTGVDVASGRTMTILCPEQFRALAKQLPGTPVELTWYPFGPLPRRYTSQSIEQRSVYFVQLGPEERSAALEHLEKLYAESGRDRWALINPHLELVVNQSAVTVQAFLLATTNADALVRVWTNTASWASARVGFYQLIPPKTGH